VPFARPSLSDLITRIGGDLRGRLELGGALLRRAMADVLAAVWAGAVHTLYGYLDWLARQLFADQADPDQLLRKAALYGITPTPATFATGNVTATGTNGSPILAGTIIRLDAVTSYQVTTGQTIAAGSATLPVTAVLAGTAANVPAGAALTFESPVPGVSSTVTIADGGIAGGVDQEGIDALRARFLLRLREPPQGGADQDYEAWALAVPGVTRAWVFPRENGLGTVVVRFVNDSDPINGINGIFPDDTAVAAVQAALDAQRPITAAVIAAAPLDLGIVFAIHIVPDTADTRAAVTAELVDLLSRVAEPGDGAGRGKVLLSQVRTAIGTADGVTDYALTVPTVDIMPAVGQLATLGGILWV
jgi:uncharacterized phage protein gp47/JayE